jgi:hypothetical protein
MTVAEKDPFADLGSGPWVCECGRRFSSAQDAFGHLDPRPRHDGYGFCHGQVTRIADEEEQ